MASKLWQLTGEASLVDRKMLLKPLKYAQFGFEALAVDRYSFAATLEMLLNHGNIHKLASKSGRGP